MELICSVLGSGHFMSAPETFVPFIRLLQDVFGS
jgi:hypothetical protein